MHLHTKLAMLDKLDEAAAEMSNANLVENAWFLRGVADAMLDRLSRTDAEDADYGIHYVKGYHAVEAWEEETA